MATCTRTGVMTTAAAAVAIALLAGGAGLLAAAGPVAAGGGVVCPDGYWMCMDGEGCVPAEVRCDGANDCADATDEYACAAPDPGADADAGAAGGGAGDATEAGAEAEAAGATEAEDAANATAGAEAGAGGCLPDEHRCLDGTCISKARICDGPRDCFDGSDEHEAAGCAPHANWTMAAVPAPAGAGAEAGAGSQECPPDAFRCSDGSCVPPSAVCDERRDCPDGGDEMQACPTRLGNCHDDFRCDDGRCVPVEWVCNGDRDCVDGSDEAPALCLHWRAPDRARARALARPPPAFDAAMPRISGDPCEHMEPAERQRCWDDQLHNLKVAEVEQRQRAAREQLEGVQAEAAAAKQLRAEQLQTAQLQHRAADELLEHQRQLHALRMQVLMHVMEKNNMTMEMVLDATKGSKEVLIDEENQ